MCWEELPLCCCPATKSKWQCASGSVALRLWCSPPCSEWPRMAWEAGRVPLDLGMKPPDSWGLYSKAGDQSYRSLKLQRHSLTKWYRWLDINRLTLHELRRRMLHSLRQWCKLRVLSVFVVGSLAHWAWMKFPTTYCRETLRCSNWLLLISCVLSRAMAVKRSTTARIAKGLQYFPHIPGCSKSSAFH